MFRIPVILRVEHDDGDSNDEPVTKSAICKIYYRLAQILVDHVPSGTGILNRNLESVKFTPLKDEESTDVSKDPGGFKAKLALSSGSQSDDVV